MASVALVLALVGAAACATPPSQPAEEPQAADPPGPMPDVQAESLNEEPPMPEPSPPAEERKSFDDMTAGERMKHMKTVVMPAMKESFQAFDSKEFAEFSCTTCHGKGAKEGRFDMPNPELPPLDKKLMDTHPAMTKFMMERVVPEMANLLGEEVYDPATHEGFGCTHCHTEKK